MQEPIASRIGSGDLGAKTRLRSCPQAQLVLQWIERGASLDLAARFGPSKSPFGKASEDCIVAVAEMVGL